MLKVGGCFSQFHPQIDGQCFIQRLTPNSAYAPCQVYAMCVLHGVGARCDMLEAVVWFNKARDQGLDTRTLANLINTPYGKSPTSAALKELEMTQKKYKEDPEGWFSGVRRQANTPDAPDAMHGLHSPQNLSRYTMALRYLLGRGTPVDMAQAASWFRLCCKRRTPTCSARAW